MAEQSVEQKKILFSGIQPTGILTLGNYIGAIRNWIHLQEEYECIFCVVDMHAITVRQEPKELRKNTLSLLALYLAAGIDPSKSTLFVQSHVPAHAELAWVLNCNSYLGELSRMTQFKDKSKKQGANISVGLLDYPVLMAADILLYQTALVPVGADQKQHLELSRDIAIRFNSHYSPTFTVPEPYIPKTGARIMSLQDPTSKMSKSDPNENGYISLLDTPDVIMRKFKRAVTDSDGCVRAAEDKPGVTNLMSIYGAITGKSMEAIEQEFEGKGYGDFKTAVADAVIATLTPIQEEQKRLLGDKPYLMGILKEGAERANYMARKTLSKVYRKIGFLGVND
ncbi:MAG: tryptophan--tRNA ligase [Clostridia bacterium]|nr:tryptophan--tRNA ligase [Clostridia bacterium]